MATKRSSWKERYPDWYGDFFKAHVGRCRRPGWPEPGTPSWPIFFEPWAEDLARVGAGPEEARAASFHLASHPPEHISDHLPGLIARVEQSRRDGLVGPSDRATAEAASRDCPECSGMGLASRDHEKPGYGRYSASYYCHRCPMGRWLKQAHGRDPKAPRLRDLAEYPELHGDPADQVDPAMVTRFHEHRRRARAAEQRRRSSRDRGPSRLFESDPESDTTPHPTPGGPSDAATR